MSPNHKQVLGAIKTLQRDLITLYRSGKRYQPLAALSKESCSEASRLMAIWIKEKFNDAELYIVKGEYQRSKYHDVLLLQLNDMFYLIDPSVWQFFKFKRNIVMETFTSKAEALSGTKRIYGGKWESLERLGSFKSEKHLIGIIKQNVSS